MKKLVFTLFACCLLLAAHTTIAQSSCFDRYMRLGKAAENNLQFENAIVQYKAARGCIGLSDGQKKTIDDNILSTQERQIDAIRKAQQRAEEALAEAERQKQRAEEALELANQAKEQAEEQKAVAEEQLEITESNRLANLADQELEKASVEDALYLAYEALNKSGNHEVAKVKRTFGDAAFAISQVPVESPENPSLRGVLSPDGVYFICYENANTVSLWQQADDKLEKIQTIDVHKSPLHAVSFSNQGDFFLTGAEDKAAILWDVSGKENATLSGHTDEVSGLKFSDNDNYILSWSRDKTARLWNRDGLLLAELTGHQASIVDAAFSPNGQYVLTRSADRQIMIWDLAGDLVTDAIKHDGYIYQASFFPNEDKVLTISADGTAKIWGIDGQVLKTMDSHASPVTAAYITEDGSKVITGDIEGNVIVWDGAGNVLVQIKEAHSEAISFLDYQMQNEVILTVGEDHNARLWNADGSSLAGLDDHTDRIIAAALVPMHDQVVTSSLDGTLKFWDFTGDLTMNYAVPNKTAVNFSMDNKGEKFLIVADGQNPILFTNPSVVFDQLQLNPPPSPSEEKMIQWGLQER